MSILGFGRKQKRKEIPNQKSGRKQKEENSQSKIKRKQKRKKVPNQRSEENRRNIQKGLWTRQYLNNTELSPSKQEKERKPQPKVVLSL